MREEYDWICPFCKQPGDHDFDNPCEAMKESQQRMEARCREMRRHAMEDECEWPLKEYTLREWKAHGLDCAVCKGEMAICGYVKVPPGHPNENHFYDDVKDISVHGGITFTCKAKGGGRWFGFDTAHFGDWWGYSYPEKNLAAEHTGRIWTVEDVVRETEEFARQFAAKGNSDGKNQSGERRETS